MKNLDVLFNPRHFLLVLPTPNSTKTQVWTSPSKPAAQKCQIHPAPPLVLAFKKGLQNHIKCCVPRKSLKFEKWFKGIKYSVSKVFSLVKLIFEFRPFSLKNKENNFSPTVRLIFDIFYGIGYSHLSNKRAASLIDF